MTHQERTLDWLPFKDKRSRAYPVTAMPRAAALPRSKLHRAPTFRLDQGSEGACVGFSQTIALMTKPTAVKVTKPETFARHVYTEAQKIDQWPGEAYEGTSLIAGAKILQQLGYIESYWWAFGIEQVLTALVTDPVTVGINWYYDMYETDPKGNVIVSGRHVGGHAITLTGSARRRDRNGTMTRMLRWRNSWGLDYGNRGDGWITEKDLAWLLEQQGEACVMRGQRLPPGSLVPDGVV